PAHSAPRDLIWALKVVSLVAGERDHATAEAELLALISREAFIEPVRGERIGQACGVERRLGGAGAGMRAQHERSIADKRDTPEHDLWRRQFEDRLEERLRPIEDVGELR